MRRLLITLFTTTLIAVTLLQGCGREPGEREYTLAMSKYKEGQLVHAKSLFESSINKRKGDAANAYAFNWLGVIEWKLGRKSDAKAYFEQSHRKNPTLPETLYNLGVMAYEEGNIEESLGYFNDCALSNPSDVQALQFIAQIQSEMGRNDDARRSLDEAIARNPAAADVLTRRAVLDIQDGNVQDAERYLMKALEMNNQYAPALFNLATLNDKYLGHKADAKTYYKEYLLLERDGPYVLEARKALTVPLTEDVLMELATATPTPRPTATRRPTATPMPTSVPRIEPTSVPQPTATPAATEIPTATPVPTVAPTATPRPPAPTPTPTPVVVTMDAQAIETYNRHMESARASSSAGKPNVALSEFINAAKVASEYGRSDLMEDAFANGAAHCFDLAPAHFAYGKFLMAKGRYPDALNSFKQASVLSPGNLAIQKPLAEAALRSEEFDTALIALKKIHSQEPDNADALWNMALIYHNRTGQDAKAIVNFQEYVSRFPDGEHVEEARLTIREIVDRKMNNGEDAKNVPPKVDRRPAVPTATPVPAVIPAKITPARPSEADRKNARMAYNKGVQSVRSGDWDKAIYYFRRTVELDPEMVKGWFNLGLSYKQQGQNAEAQQAYIKSLELKPDMSAARYNLALLYFDRQQFTNAERECIELLRFNSDYASAHLLLGLIYERNPATKTKAIYHYEQFLRFSPNAPEAPGVRQWLQRNEKSFSRT
ncbi:MAG: tetratricopeptide repeat protein [Spartobacteria bacterium]|nr:tetratricopeptide repeat protein [Spartobacteria bacterium]